MPCDSSYMEPTEEEQNSLTVCKFLEEIGLDKLQTYDDNYGRTETLDRDTARLCGYLKTLTPHGLQMYSLELQIWWRDHRIADKKKANAKAVKQHEADIREKALGKLTAEERRVLGVNRHRE